MSFTPEEASQIKVDVEVLKNTTSQVLVAIGENTEQSKENAVLINSLINKMDAHDVRREYEAKEREADREHIEKLDGKITETNHRIDLYIDSIAPTMARVKAKHEAIDNFKKSMGTTWGKMTATILVSAMVLFAAYVLGVEIKL